MNPSLLFPVIADVLVCSTILILSVRKHYTLPNITNAFLFYTQVSKFIQFQEYRVLLFFLSFLLIFLCISIFCKLNNPIIFFSKSRSFIIVYTIIILYITMMYDHSIILIVTIDLQAKTSEVMSKCPYLRDANKK